MKKLVTSASALSLTVVPGFASENDWSQLDKEVEALTASLQSDDGPMISGFIRTLFQNSSDIPIVGLDDDGDPTLDLGDLSGFSVPDARIELEGNVGDYSYRIEYDTVGIGGLGLDGLLDAYINFPIGTVNGTMGQFKPPVLRSSLVDRDQLLFVDRTGVGEIFAVRDQGLMVSGDFDALGWWLTIQNGSDDVGDEYFFAGRAAFDFLGEGVGDSAEGAYGGTDEPSATVGVAYFNDGFTEIDGFALDGYLATNVYSFGFELVSLGEAEAAPPPGLSGFGGIPGGLASGAFLVADDSTPFAVVGSYMLTPETWEIAARFQDFDDDADSNKIDVAVNYYIEGHDLKWTVQYSTIDSDAGDADVITLGLLLAF